MLILKLYTVRRQDTEYRIQETEVFVSPSSENPFRNALGILLLTPDF